MARVYDSPTTNLFALLAEEADQPQRKAKANATKGGNELTPKERAAAKAVQDAEHKAKRDAERAKQAEAEARILRILTLKWTRLLVVLIAIEFTIFP